MFEDRIPELWADSAALQPLLLQSAVAVGKYGGVLAAMEGSGQFWGSLGLVHVMRLYPDEVRSVGADEFLWLSGAEAGTVAAVPQAQRVLRWHAAFGATWQNLQRRPMLNTGVLEKMLGMVHGRAKRVRSARREGMTLTEHMRRLDHFLHLDSRFDPMVRSLAAADELRRLKPFPQDSESVADLLPSLNIALEYGLELPLLDVSGEFSRSNGSVRARLQGLADGLHSTIDAVSDIRRMARQAYSRSLDLLPARMQSQALFEVVFSRPTLKVRDLVDGGIVQRQTAAEYLRALEEARMLRSRRVGREVLFRNELLCEYLLDLR